MRRVASFLLLFLTYAAVPATSDVRLSFFEVERVGGDVVLRWQTEAEQGARDFELYRMVFEQNASVRLAALPAHGSGKPYLWKENHTSGDDGGGSGRGDAHAEYRLEVVLQSGARQALPLEPTRRAAFTLRRAWSSIKAMLQ